MNNELGGVTLRIAAEVVVDAANLYERQARIVEALRALGSDIAFDITVAGYTDAEAELQQKLGMGIGVALENYGNDEIKLPPRVKDRLDWADLHTVRDVFVVGKKGLRAIRTFGDTIIDRIESNLSELCPTVPLEDEPSMETIVRVCGTLDKVTCRVLDIINSSYGVHGCSSVQDIINLTVEEIAQKIAPQSLYSGRELEWLKRAEPIFEQAHAFAQRFVAARERSFSS